MLRIERLSLCDEDHLFLYLPRRSRCCRFIGVQRSQTFGSSSSTSFANGVQRTPPRVKFSNTIDTATAFSPAKSITPYQDLACVVPIWRAIQVTALFSQLYTKSPGPTECVKRGPRKPKQITNRQGFSGSFYSSFAIPHFPAHGENRDTPKYDRGPKGPRPVAMPSSPRTPNRRQQSTSIDLSFTSASSQINGYDSIRPHSRKSSLSSLRSLRSPATPRPRSLHEPNGYFGSSNDYGNTVEAGNGLGSLADELAEAWDSEEDMEEVVPAPQATADGAMCNSGSQQQVREQIDQPHYKNFSRPSYSIPQPATTGSLSPPKLPPRPKHKRQDSHYDGSDYGDDSDFEDATGISPSLNARIAVIENLARRGSESNGSDADGVILRVADLLKDLGSQSGVENGASR